MDHIGIWAYWRKWESRVLLRLALAALIGITLGALVFHLMAPWTIRLLIGVIARGFTANYWVRRIARNGTPERRSEEHTTELQSLMRTSYGVFCLKKKTITTTMYTIERPQSDKINKK